MWVVPVEVEAVDDDVHADVGSSVEEEAKRLNRNMIDHTDAR